jgi:putative peptidoglycan lipid II flippase
LPLVATLFGYGRFRPEDATMTAAAVQMMCLGIPAFMASKVLLPAFYARQDTRTPMRIAVRTVIANVVLTVLIATPLWWFGIARAHAGIAAATAIAGTLNAWWLYRALAGQGLYRLEAGLRRFVAKVLLAALLMYAAVAILAHQAGDWFALPWWHRLLLSLGLVATGAIVFTGVAAALGIRPRDVREPRD